ncbi:SsgA family sporulation/cell division regulator [Streptomyces longwoodensis]|uniref:SsgA family sporulation/cell division regulator n=1 Tax=Streptomyces longwoodensis TaxID=68231 RepID=UPI0033F773D0
MILRKDATDVAAPEVDDFDALLNASSLGAPHVLAETERIPADVRRRLSRAAARPARCDAVPQPPNQTDDAAAHRAGRLPTHSNRLVSQVVSRPLVVLTGLPGSGKSALAHVLLRRLMQPWPAARSGASPAWRKKLWQSALEDCEHLAHDTRAGFGWQALSAWPTGCAGADPNALLGSFAHAHLPGYPQDDDLLAPQACRPVLQPARMTELLIPLQAPAAPASLPWLEPQQETFTRALVLLDRCEPAAKRLLPEPYLGWLGRPVREGAGHALPLAPRSNGPLSPLHADFSWMLGDLHTDGRWLPPGLPHAGLSRWRAPECRESTWPGKAWDEVSDAHCRYCQHHEERAGGSPTRARPLLLYAVGHGIREGCSASWHGQSDAIWPDLMWTEQADDGAIEHAVVPMTVHQQKGTREAEVPVRVTYRSGDPYAVETVFYRGDPGDEVVWSFARDLLIDGLQHSGGEGDVTVWTPPSLPARQTERRTFIQLSSPEGTALLSAPHAQLKRFMDKTLLLVAAGSEHQRFRSTLDRFETELGELACPGSGD